MVEMRQTLEVQLKDCDGVLESIKAMGESFDRLNDSMKDFAKRIECLEEARDNDLRRTSEQG